MSDWKSVIAREWQRHSARGHSSEFFPLISQSFDEREIVAAVEALLTGRLTMGEQVRQFENRFAAHVGAKFAVMVNSGSSANLLALAVACNPARKKRLQPGDEVLVPAVCWPTSVWPIVQMNLKPVFVDVDPTTLNVDVADLQKKITPRTRALMAVHILGNSAPMRDVLSLVRAHELFLIEDTCESLGARFAGRHLGTLGDFGCYSFYYSHHITTGEGGMVVCNDAADYDLLKCLRAHGWSRDVSNCAEIERQNPDIDPRFLMVNLGYNLRPTEVQAAFGICQLDRLDAMNEIRNRNRENVISTLRSHPRWREQLCFAVASPETQPAWFGFVALLSPRFARQQKEYLRYLTNHGVENRPIVSGNFLRQPAVQLLGLDHQAQDFPGAEEIHRRGFFIGLHTQPLEAETVGRLADILLGYDFGA